MRWGLVGGEWCVVGYGGMVVGGEGVVKVCVEWLGGRT